MKRILKLFSVHDVKAGVYHAPFPSLNNATAIRQFGDMVKQGAQTPYANHPEDYALFHVGEYCDEDCSLVSTDRVRLIGGHELLSNLAQ